MKDNNKNCQNKKLFNIVVVVTMVLVSCGFVDYALGMSNPVAVYCDELGYQYIIKETVDGQQGFCQFSSGVAIDGWKFFIGEEGQNYSYCQKQGLEVKTIISEQCQYASKCAVCILKNGTEVRITELMELDLKSTLLPWDPVEPISDTTTMPEHKTNYFFYFLGVVVLTIILVISFIVYKKIKNRNSYYE